MQLYALIAAFIGVFLSSALVSAIEGNPLQVTDITTSRVTTGNISISFQVYDPDPLTDSSTTCTATWKYGSQGYPKETYSLCDNDTFAWNMGSFTGYNRFTLGLQHRFTDPSVGDPPYDSVKTFSRAVVKKKALDCEKDGNSVACSQKDVAIIEAPIYAITA